MKAITLRQPWAWAVLYAGKDVENRTQNIAGDYRGPVMVHAGLGWDPAGLDAIRALGVEPPAGYVRGMVLGVVELVDVHHGWMEPQGRPCSPWGQDYVGLHHLMLANPRPLERPLPARGALGLWTLPADVSAAVLEQLVSVTQ